MNKFLTLKHWQLFLILIGPPIILQPLMMVSVFSNAGFSRLLILFPIMMIFSVGVFFGWYYALGTNLNNKLPQSLKMNITKFKWFLFIPSVYILLLCLFLFGLFAFGSRLYDPPMAIFAIIIPIHLFSMFCIFYCLYFVAKALKSVELQQPVSFSDYAGEFFLMWFFIIGIWIIQPRINKIFEPGNDQVMSDFDSI